MSNRLVPRLRFKEFNNQWLNKNLNNFSNIIMGQSPLSKNYTDDNSSYLLIQGNADLKEGKIFPRLYTTQVTKITRKNDIILTVRAPVGEVAINNYGNAVIGRGVSSITGNYFLYSMFNYFKLSNYWNKFSTGSTFDSIDSNTLKNVKINVPSLSEQQKIGQFFSKLDRLIDLQSQNLSHLKQLKKGYLQKMFPQKGESVPRLRFDGFRDEWHKSKLKDISNIVGGGTPSTKNKEYWNGNINWYAPDEISKSDSIYTYQSKNKITNSGLKHSAAKIHPINTILFTSRAGIGSMAILKNPASTNQGFQSLELKSNTSPYFIYSYRNIIKYKALKMAHGSTFLEISNKEMSNINLVIPSIQEQNKIGQFFKYLDQSIIRQGNKLIQLKRLKKAYLQKMFI